MGGRGEINNTRGGRPAREPEGTKAHAPARHKCNTNFRAAMKGEKSIAAVEVRIAGVVGTKVERMQGQCQSCSVMLSRTRTANVTVVRHGITVHEPPFDRRSAPLRHVDKMRHAAGACCVFTASRAAAETARSLPTAERPCGPGPRSLPAPPRTSRSRHTAPVPARYRPPCGRRTAPASP